MVVTQQREGQTLESTNEICRLSLVSMKFQSDVIVTTFRLVTTQRVNLSVFYSCISFVSSSELDSEDDDEDVSELVLAKSALPDDTVDTAAAMEGVDMTAEGAVMVRDAVDGAGVVMLVVVMKALLGEEKEGNGGRLCIWFDVHISNSSHISSSNLPIMPWLVHNEVSRHLLSWSAMPHPHTLSLVHSAMCLPLVFFSRIFLAIGFSINFCRTPSLHNLCALDSHSDRIKFFTFHPSSLL